MKSFEIDQNSGGNMNMISLVNHFTVSFMFMVTLGLSACTESGSQKDKAPDGPTITLSPNEPNTKNTKEGSTSSKETVAPNIEIIAKNKPSDPNSFFMDYPSRYCEHVWKLKLRADISEDLKYFCDGSKPTKELLDWREKLILSPGKIEIKRVFYEASKESDYTEIKMVWGYYLPQLRPFRVKDKPLYSFIAKSILDEIMDLKSKAERQSDDAVDYGMHLWNTKMSYDLNLLAAPGIVLSSKRDTQYNLYQVESGNEEMGFGVETLTDGHGIDYTQSIMLNLTFNDGTGYNDEIGGAVIVNMLHLKMSNKGFIETTEKTLERLGLFFATSMYEGLTGKKALKLKN